MPLMSRSLTREEDVYLYVFSDDVLWQTMYRYVWDSTLSLR